MVSVGGVSELVGRRCVGTGRICCGWASDLVFFGVGWPKMRESERVRVKERERDGG